MIQYIIEGLIFGTGLAVSLGPIFIALTQTSINKGVLPGLTVGSGIWVSDILIVAIIYKFISSIQINIESDDFRLWMGLSGALILIGFGTYMVVRKPVIDYTEQKHNYKNYIGFWLKGFLVNAVNPFTFFFWMGVISTYIIGRNISHTNALVLLTTIIFVIVLSDMGKVLLASFLKRRLTDRNIELVTNFSGIFLISFGLFMVYQVA